MTEPRRCVLLIFVKAPRPGHAKTRLARGLGSSVAIRVYRTLGRSVVERVRGGRYESVVYFDPPTARDEISDWLGEDDLSYLAQSDGDLGQRLEQGFAWAFRNADAVCAIGTDVPDLSRSHVESAFDALMRADGPDLVLGPALDGGYYLVALRRPEPSLFRQVPWSTDRTLDATLARARAADLKVELLPPLADVDDPEDVPRGLLDEADPI